jgi:ABC-2 type transport system permease protein
MPVAAPGDSPFKSVPGQSFLTSLSVFAVWGVCVVVGAPALALALISVSTGQMVLGWISLLVGIVVGVAATIIGITVGGRTLDRTGPDLLARMKAFPR